MVDGRGSRKWFAARSLLPAHRNTRPNKYPIPKNTNMTTATTSATRPAIVRKFGCSLGSFIALEVRSAEPARAGKQVRDQIDRPSREHESTGPRELARALERLARVGDDFGRRTI